MKRITLIFMLVAPLVGAVIWLLQDHQHKVKTAYCFEEERYISQEEICDTAVAALYDRLEKYNSVFSDEEKAQVVIYSSPQDIKSRNPLICESDAKPFAGQYDARSDGLFKFLRQRYGGSFYISPLRLQLVKSPLTASDGGQHSKSIKKVGATVVHVDVMSCGKEHRRVYINNDDLYPRNDLRVYERYYKGK